MVPRWGWAASLWQGLRYRRILREVVKPSCAAAHKRKVLIAMQYELALIPHKVGKEIVSQRSKDGYINATAMCKAAGKEWSNYRKNQNTSAFLDALASALRIRRTDLIQSIIGGPPALQGTWVHPQVAINLAQWLSPEFAVKVSEWVFDWMSGRAPDIVRPLPFHLRRYIANQLNVPPGHFSVLTELTQCLVGPMEATGYTLPEHLWPDISEGRMFCQMLRDEHGIDTDALPTYIHVFEDGRPPVRAKAYPEELLPAFRTHFREVWFPRRAADYFKARDPRALQYLSPLLPRPTKKAS